MRIKILLLLFFPLMCLSQTKIISGKIQIESPMISDILIINLTKQIEVKSNGLGVFKIEAELEDLLVISAPHVYKKRHIVQENDFKEELIIVLEVKPIEIEEVQIVRSNINSVSLGLVSKDQKRYTVEERRLFTSQSGGLIGGIIDGISGRRKMLKNLERLSAEDRRVRYLDLHFSEKFFTEDLKIPNDKVNEFKYFVLNEIEKDVNEKNRKDYLQSIPKKDLEQQILLISEKYKIQLGIGE